ncbi:MAG: hypothetical protein ACKVQK_20700 [Burkholderiales bacterium]
MPRPNLPAQFSDLQPFVQAWAYATEKERHDKLISSSIEELRPFYDAMLPRMDEITVYLNRFPLDAMPASEQLLLDLAMGFMESAHPIDLHWKTTDIEDKFPAHRFKFFPPSCA